MKKLLAIIIAGILVISMVACSRVDEPAGDTTPPPATDETVEPKTLKINGVDISEYKIVYAKNPDAYKYIRAKSLVTQDTEYDEQSAKHLAELIKEHFGVELEVVKDSKDATDKEIIIGKTKRGLSGDAKTAYESSNDKAMCVLEKDGKLMIAGASYGATWHAVEEFIAKCVATEGNTVNIESGYSFKGDANIVVVGCIGDSLTFGTKPTPNYNSKIDDGIRADIVPYPAVLQRLAWKDMVVYNYGKGGRTMTEGYMWDDDNNGTLDTDHAWIKTAEHTACMKNAENFDLVLMMLGTNDANSGRAKAAGFNFNSAHETAFINSCQKIVNELKAKNPNVRIALLNCPIAFRADIEDYAAGYIRKYQEHAAQQLGLDLLDMYTFTKNNTTAADYPDNLHPKDEGYTKYAEGIYSMITPIVNELLAKK
jgi:lysophospholipase L1-like esterase